MAGSNTSFLWTVITSSSPYPQIDDHVHVALLCGGVELALQLPLEVPDLVLLPLLVALCTSMLLAKPAHVRLQALELPGGGGGGGDVRGVVWWVG